MNENTLTVWCRSQGSKQALLDTESVKFLQSHLRMSTVTLYFRRKDMHDSTSTVVYKSKAQIYARSNHRVNFEIITTCTLIINLCTIFFTKFFLVQMQQAFGYIYLYIPHMLILLRQKMQYI